MAPIDVTTDYESKWRAAKLLSPFQAMAVLATHPVVLFIAMLVFAIIIGGVAFSFYQPVFSAYQSSCIHSDSGQLARGVFTANAYALAFNYATHEGNKLRLDGLDAYELDRADTCARYGERSASDEQRVQNQMDLIVGSHVRVQADVALMRRCYDTTVLDASFTTTPVVDENGNAFPLLSSTLSEAACDETLTNSTLADGVFDCTELPDCILSCNDLADENGIDSSELFSYARVAMCTAQWWIHSTLLRMVFTVAIWLFINLFRVVFLGGVIRLCWNYFNSGMYTYLATCNIEAVHTYARPSSSLGDTYTCHARLTLDPAALGDTWQVQGGRSRRQGPVDALWHAPPRRRLHHGGARHAGALDRRPLLLYGPRGRVRCTHMILCQKARDTRGGLASNLAR